MPRQSNLLNLKPMEKTSVPLCTRSSSSSTPPISFANSINVVQPQNSQFFTIMQPQRFLTTLSPFNFRVYMSNSSALQTGLQVLCADNFVPITQPIVRTFLLGRPGAATSIPPASPLHVSTISGVEGSYSFVPHTDPAANNAPMTQPVCDNQRFAHPGSLLIDGSSLTGFSEVDPLHQTGVGEQQDTFIMSDERRLRVLLKKKFRHCDLGSPCRIFIPKRIAEMDLPPLAEKEGIQLLIRDLYTDQIWKIRYKFWNNTSGRVYLIYCDKDFVSQKGLEAGDTINLYQDESKNLYISLDKEGRPPGPVTSRQQESTKTSAGNKTLSVAYSWGPSTAGAREEEDEYLAILIEELKYKDQRYANCLGIL